MAAAAEARRASLAAFLDAGTRGLERGISELEVELDPAQASRSNAPQNSKRRASANAGRARSSTSSALTEDEGDALLREVEDNAVAELRLLLPDASREACLTALRRHGLEVEKAACDLLVDAAG